MLLRGFEKDILTAVTILSRFPGALAHWRESQLGELSNISLCMEDNRIYC